MKESPLLLRLLRQDHLLSQRKTAIIGILQCETVILVLVNADFIARNVCTGSWKTACTRMCICVSSIHVYRKKQRRKWVFSCLQGGKSGRVGKVGPLPQMSPGTAAKVCQDRDMAGCHLFVLPRLTGIAQLCGPKGVQSCAHTHAHTHTRTKINTHTFSACCLWSKSCLKATVEL